MIFFDNFVDSENSLFTRSIKKPGFPACVFAAPEARIHSLQQKCGSWIDDFISAIKDPNFSFEGYLGDYRQSAEVIESL